MAKQKAMSPETVGCLISVRNTSGTYIARAAGLNITANCTAGAVPAAHACADKVFGKGNWSMTQTLNDTFACSRNVGVAEPQTRMGPAARRATKRAASLWIKVRDEMPDGDIMVLVRVDQDDDESFATAAYWSGSMWRDAIDAMPVRRVRAWMHMHDALAALAKTRGEVKP